MNDIKTRLAALEEALELRRLAQTEPVDDLSQSLFEMGKWLAGLDEQGKAELLQSLNEDELSMSAEDLKWFISDYTEV